VPERMHLCMCMHAPAHERMHLEQPDGHLTAPSCSRPQLQCSRARPTALHCEEVATAHPHPHCLSPLPLIAFSIASPHRLAPNTTWAGPPHTPTPFSFRRRCEREEGNHKSLSSSHSPRPLSRGSCAAARARACAPAPSCATRSCAPRLSARPRLPPAPAAS